MRLLSSSRPSSGRLFSSVRVSNFRRFATLFPAAVGLEENTNREHAEVVEDRFLVKIQDASPLQMSHSRGNG